MNISYDLILKESQHFEEKDYIKTKASNKQPPWFQRLSVFLFNSNSLKEAAFKLINMGVNQLHTLKTAKGCPAFINLFTQSVAITTAADIFIKVCKDNETGLYTSVSMSTDQTLKVGQHADEQIGDLGKRVVILKFSLPIAWVTDEDCQFQYTDPHIYNDVPYKVCPGIITQKKGTVSYFNMPVFFHKIDAEYYIKAGTVIGYLQFDKPVKSFFRKDLSELSNKEIYKKHVLGNIKHLIGK